MEEKIKLSALYEIYKELFTEKMKTIFELYYYSDLSLREIAINKDISYQAVRDFLKKAEKELHNYEEKLHVYELKQELNNKRVK